MSDTVDTMRAGESPHAWIHENLATYLANGLSAEERQRFDAHVNACAECFDAFTEARDADRALLRAFAGLTPDSQFEEQVITHFRENTMKRLVHPMVRRAGYAAAACVALAATGVFANYVLHSESRLNNPFSKQLVAQADAAVPTLNGRTEQLAAYVRDEWAGELAPQAVTSVQVKGETGGGYVDLARNGLGGRSVGTATGRLQTRMPSQAVTGIVGDETKSSEARLPATQPGAPHVLAAAPANSNGSVDRGYTPMGLLENEEKSRAADAAQKQQEYEGIMHRTGLETMRQNVDFADHLIPSKSLASGSRVGDGTLHDDKSAGAGIQYERPTSDYVGFSFGFRDPKNVEGVSQHATVVADKPADLFSTSGPVAAGAWGISSGGDGKESGRESYQLAYQGGGNGNTPAGAFTKSGSGTLTRGGNNTFAGGTIITSGAITLDENVAAGKEQKLKTELADGPAIAVLGAQSGLAGPSAKDRDTLGEDQSRLLDARAAKEANGPVVDLRTSAEAPQMVTTGGRELFDSLSARKNAADQKSSASAVRGTDFGDAGRQVAAGQQGQGGQQPGNQADPARPAVTTRPVAAPTTQATETIAQLKIIRNGTVEFEVRSFDDTYRTVQRIVTEERGFISSTSSDKLANGKVRGVIVVRVPPDHLDYFLQGIRALGDLKAQQISANDVTKDYYDVASELRGLTTMETRLLDLIKNGKGEVKDLIEAEKQLGETRIKIERLKGQIAYYDNLVSLCTITITAYEKDIQTPTAASEQEIVTVNVETEEVEAKYQAARKVFEEAKARIVESQLKNTDAEHVAAHIVAEVPPEQADFVANQMKQLGKVASFNRDRKQTTSGGTGTPNVEVVRKDTRITIDLFNLANMQPRETTVLRIAVPNVEAAYTEILARVRRDAAAEGAAAVPGDATPHTVGRVIASALNGQQAEQMTADVRAEVRSESADAVIAAIRASGEVLASSLAANPDNASTTSAKRGIQIRLENIASVQPRQAQNITIAVRNVEAAYNDLVNTVRRQGSATTQPAAGVGRNGATSRVVVSQLSGQRPDEMVGDVRAEIISDLADDVISRVKGSGEVINSNTVDVPDNQVATAVKRGLYVRFISVASVNAREAQDIHAVALDVTASYKSLLASLQTLVDKGVADGGKGGAVRILTSSLSGTDRRRMTASFTFDAPRSAEGDINKAFELAGIDFLSRNIVRSTDTAGTLDTKVRYQIDEIRAADSLEPRRTFNITREMPDVDKALNELRVSLPVNMPPLDFNISRQSNGAVAAHAVLDLSVEDSRAVRTVIARLGGVEKDNQVSNNNNVPETRFARERVDVTLYSNALPGPLLKENQTFGATMRAALGTAAGVLFQSLYLIIVGAVFILPFALVLWPVWRILRRRRAVVKA